MNKMLALIVLGFALHPALADAGNGPRSGDDRCGDIASPRMGRAALDLNKDGFISREEASSAPRLLQRFEQLDNNQDGRLSLEERRAGHAPRGFVLADTNGDGQVSRQEAEAFRPLLDRFATLDSNRDSVLSADELQAGRPCRGDGPGRGSARQGQ